MKLASNHRMVRDIAVISTDMSGKITVFNHVAEQILGYPAQEIIGKAIPIDDFMNFQADPESFFNRPIEAEFTHANGEPILLEALLSPIQNAEGADRGILLTAHRVFQQRESFTIQSIPDENVFNIVLKREINRLQRDGQTLSVIKIDIDHYTAYLQHYGETKTKELLQEIGYTLQERIQRASDLLAYCGSDEFWVLLPNTDLPGVVKVAEQLRLKVMGLAWPTHVSDIDNKITVSLGIAHLSPKRETTVDDVRSLADAALAEAKSQGRNCTRYKLPDNESC